MKDSKTVSVRDMPSELWDEFGSYALYQGTTVGEYFRKVVQQEVEKARQDKVFRTWFKNRTLAKGE